MFLDLVKTVSKGKVIKQITENFISTSLPNTISTFGTTYTIDTSRKLVLSSTESVGTRETGIKSFTFNLLDYKLVTFTVEGFKGTDDSLSYYIMLEKDGVTGTNFQFWNDRARVMENSLENITKQMNYSLNGTGVGTKKKNLTLAIDIPNTLLYLLEDDQVVWKENVSNHQLDLTGLWNFKTNVYDSTKTKTTGLEIAQLKIELHS